MTTPLACAPHTQSESLVRYLAIARTKGDGMSDEKHEVLASLLVNANDKQLANFASNVTKIMNKASRLMAKSSLVKLDPNEEDWSVHVHFHSIGLFTFALIAFTARNFGTHARHAAPRRLPLRYHLLLLFFFFFFFCYWCYSVFSAVTAFSPPSPTNASSQARTSSPPTS